MKTSDAERIEFINYIKEFLEHEQIHEMKKYIQHGNTTTFTHCLIVAYYSYLLSLRLPIKFNRKSLIRGAMLHDFYLYDWHVADDSHRLHGYFHPEKALLNSKKYFQLNDIEIDIIEKHMWPLTIRKIPLYREALLVCFIDKFCSLCETLYIPPLPKEYKRLSKMLNSKKLVY